MASNKVKFLFPLRSFSGSLYLYEHSGVSGEIGKGFLLKWGEIGPRPFEAQCRNFVGREAPRGPKGCFGNGHRRKVSQVFFPPNIGNNDFVFWISSPLSPRRLEKCFPTCSLQHGFLQSHVKWRKGYWFLHDRNKRGARRSYADLSLARPKKFAGAKRSNLFYPSLWGIFLRYLNRPEA